MSPEASAPADGEAFGDRTNCQRPRCTAKAAQPRPLSGTGACWPPSCEPIRHVIERALFNASMSGCLEWHPYIAIAIRWPSIVAATRFRNEWYDTTSLRRSRAHAGFAAGYFYSTSGDGRYVHLTILSLDWHSKTHRLKIRRRHYPWDGATKLWYTRATYRIYLLCSHSRWSDTRMSRQR